jgi:hypothetical protein
MKCKWLRVPRVRVELWEILQHGRFVHRDLNPRPVGYEAGMLPTFSAWFLCLALPKYHPRFLSDALGEKKTAYCPGGSRDGVDGIAARPGVRWLSKTLGIVWKFGTSDGWHEAGSVLNTHKNWVPSCKSLPWTRVQSRLNLIHTN